MRSYLRKKLAGLAGCTSGNATVIVALGMPMLIGGAGLGVDAAQWYMWKRELQFAVDQAAVAAAWARSDAETRDTFKTRARQEFEANTAATENFATLDDADIIVADYDGGTANSVTVEASATRALPFTSFVTGDQTTVSAFAQAVIEQGADFHACMLALNKTASQAFKFGGSVSGSSSCGAGTLSTSNNMAMKELGDNDVPLGTVVAGGEVDPNFKNNGTIHGYQEGLSNPYEGLEPPSPSGEPNQAYPATCPSAQPASTTYAANGTTRTHFTYVYYKGNSESNVIPYGVGDTGYIAPSWSDPVPFTNKSVTSTATGVQTETIAAGGSPTKLNNKNGANAIWRRPYTSTQDTITEVYEHQTAATDGKVYLQPGVYDSIEIACKTIFTPGVYFVNGDLDFGSNQEVTGTGGVMFVLNDPGAIKVNSDSHVTLSGISAATLINEYGYDSEEAAKLAGMLIWDPDSTEDFTFNGNANLHLSGILYIPKRHAKFNGDADVAGSCIMVAADTMQMNGNFSLSNFCVTTGASAMSIGGTITSVRLVA